MEVALVKVLKLVLVIVTMVAKVAPVRDGSVCGGGCAGGSPGCGSWTAAMVPASALWHESLSFYASDWTAFCTSSHARWTKLD